MNSLFGAALLGLASLVSAQGPPGGGGGGSPAYTLYQAALPIPPVIQPTFQITTKDGRTVQAYNLTIQSFTKQVYPNLGSASMVGYNGIAPGPLFVVERGVETVVRVWNKGSNNAAVHLHGSFNHAPWDGWALDDMSTNEYKDYYWPNLESGRSIWYHDHTDQITAVNAYFGQAGPYIIHDPAEDSLGLPNGKYDVPMMLSDKTYNSNGGLVSPAGNTFNFFGDVIHVNGQPWPFMNVEPRKYRLRFYDTSLSRAYTLAFQNAAGNNMNFQVIASDSGLFGKPISTTSLTISMGERYEVVVDFSSVSGQNVVLRNSFTTAGTTSFTNTDKVMQFKVGTTVSSTANNGAVPSTLNSNIDYPAARSTIDHTFNFQIGGGAQWTINGVPFSDANNRVLAKPPQGAVERWRLVHSGGPAVHPVHIHMVNMQILSRTGGRGSVLPYENAGLKDTVLLQPGETVDVLALYGPWDGLYMFHCHNLIHEDNAMMAAFNVTLLASLGYPETQGYDDPMDSRYAPKPYSVRIESLITCYGIIG
jgi:bilirubin oxidase